MSSEVDAAPQACAGVTCESPPPDVCANTTTLRRFESPGTCTNGTCGYPSVDVACPSTDHGQPACMDGACGFACDANYRPCSTGCCYRFSVEFTGNSQERCYSVWGTFTGDVYMACTQFANGTSYAEVEHTTGNGVWDSSFDFGELFAYAVWGSGPQDIYVVGSRGNLAHSTGGGHWTGQTTGAAAINLRAVWGSGPADVYTVGDAGRIFHSTGNGTWTAQTSGTTNNLRAVWGSGAGDVYAAGDSGTLVHSTGNGAWTVLDSGTDANLSSIWGSAANDVYFVGPGIIQHLTGTGWTTDSLVGGEAVWGSAANDVYVVRLNGLMSHSTGNGTWTALPLIMGAEFLNYSGIWGSSSSDIYISSSSIGGKLVHAD